VERNGSQVIRCLERKIRKRNAGRPRRRKEELGDGDEGPEVERDQGQGEIFAIFCLLN